MEKALAKLMLRDLDGLAEDIGAWFAAGRGSEEALVAALSQSNVQDNGVGAIEEEAHDRRIDVVLIALEDNFMAALATATLALERGDEALLSRARERLQNGIEVAADLELVPAWWIHRLTIHLLGDLWDTSFHKVLPLGRTPW